MGQSNDKTSPKHEDTHFGVLHVLLENLRGLGSRRERCWGYASVYENTPEKLILKTISP